ncbi:MAG: DNA polymerase III subunit beta [Elusimicrobiota bacterium]|jgi:DNA polymerase-3 subunit beta|nr:DNA polymerase III subunit beta [Elusimicrobiota bacterium]
MKVICAKDELIKGLLTVSPITPSKSSLPVLSNFLFQAQSDKIRLSSTDLEIAVKCNVKAEIEQEGAITIPTKRFTDIIREMHDDAQIEISADDSNQINIKSGKAKFNLMGIAAAEFPVIPEFPKENNFTVKTDIFASMIKKTSFAASKDPQRYILNGIYTLIEDETLKMVSTDGRRLAYISVKGIGAKVKAKAIVPTKAVNDILRLISSEIKAEGIKVGLSENLVAVEFDDIILTSVLIEGLFPNYEQVIPKKTVFKVELRTQETLKAVKQMALLTNEKSAADRSSAVKFAFGGNLLTISASTAGLGSGDVEIPIEYKEDPIEISFNPAFIKDVLQNMEEEAVSFEFSDALNPAIISPQKDKDYLCVVMPMRV